MPPSPELNIKASKKQAETGRQPSPFGLIMEPED
jgi:hypothetical protein